LPREAPEQPEKGCCLSSGQKQSEILEELCQESKRDECIWLYIYFNWFATWIYLIEYASTAFCNFLLASVRLNMLVNRTLVVYSSPYLGSAALRDTFHPRLLGKAAKRI
jgi:hypothetical protein